jgi:dienelactone hydrolase
MSARSYLDRSQHGTDLFGVQSADPAIGRVRVPLLAFFGTDEAWVGGAAELELIKRNATGAPRVETHLFEGADHSYTGHHAAVGERLATWLATLR